MVHGLETMQRLNEEAIAKQTDVIGLPEDNAVGEHNEWRRIAMGFSFAFAMILVMIAVSKWFEWAMNKDTLRPFVQEVQVEPLYHYGEQVFFTEGFYIGQRGDVIGWNELDCDYMVRVAGRVAFNVPEDHLESLERSTFDWQKSERNRKMQSAEEILFGPEPASPFD